MLTVIGCGNSNRRDDAAGVAVVQRLLSHFNHQPPEGIRIFDAGTGGMEVMFQARGSRELLVVDACTSGSEPGALFEVPGSELATRPAPAFNLHDFRWENALFAGRQIYRDDFPEAVTVYLIEAADLELGTGLTEAVEACVEKVVEKILHRIDCRDE